MSDKKRILYVVESLSTGILTYLVDLSNELCKIYDIFIAYSTRPQTPENYRDYFDPSVKLIRVKDFTRNINPVKDLKAFKEVRRIAEEVKPDIVHLHSSKAGAIGRFAFDGKKVPLFYTPHGYSFLMENYTPMKRRIFKFIERVCAKSHCTTISCSAGEHKETLNLTKRAIFINNGISMAELDNMVSKVKKVDHPFTVFTSGRVCCQKNPRLFNQIAEAMPETKFLWLGGGDELRDELKSPNIEVTGWLEREQVIDRSYNADVFLLTSLWEGLPISLLEAMYMKKLCVVNDAIGNHDVIHDGKNGFVCRTVEEFKKAIETKDTEALIEAAYKDIEENYNSKVMAKKYAEIYEEAIKKMKEGK